MGEPDNPEAFVPFEIGDLTIYVTQQMLEKLEPGTQQMDFYLGSYGRYTLVFSEPWRDATGGDV